MPVTDTPPILEPGETLVAEIRSDRGRYWRDHGIMAVALMALAGGVLWATGTPYPAIGSLGAILAVGVRAAYLASETLGLRWRLTDRRIILPGGQRSVPLLDLKTARVFFGDVQLITQSGDKHLLKHVAGGPALVEKILKARDRRAKRRAN